MGQSAGFPGNGPDGGSLGPETSAVMPSSPRRLLVLMAATAAAAALACGEGPTRPVSPPGSGPPANAIVRLDLSAPPEIAPGETVQLTLKTVRADGSVENITGQAQWVVTNLRTQTPETSVILEVSSSGLASAKDRGEVSVSARFAGWETIARVLVLPPGTFHFAGKLSDGPLAVRDATVSISEGVGAGLAGLTGADGSFHIFGVSGSFIWRATKAGYADLIRRATIAGHTRNLGLYRMAPSAARDDYTGTYDLTISTRPECSSSPELFPAVARQRAYMATIKQTASELVVTLTGGDFVLHNGSGNTFVGEMSSTGEAVFWLGFYWGDYAIAERLGPVALLFDGIAFATGTGDGISGRMDGYAYIASTPTYPFERTSARCPTDRFELVRR